MKWWRQWQEARFAARHPFPDAQWRQVRKRLPLLRALDSEDATRLGQRAWRLMHHKRLSNPARLAFGMEDYLALAAQACLLTLGWEQRDAEAAFSNVHEVLLLPDAFRRKGEELDDAGVMHVYEDERAGETWYQGPVVIALPDFQASGGWDGFNVVIHEFAHKLDMGNSMDADGFPPLPRDMSAGEWHRVFTAVWDDLQTRLERGEPTPIDDYAASDPGECFTVSCEAFFAAPDALNAAYPELYALLRRYFRQDPLVRLKGTQRT
ncbi:M90 family metallopeptidase [Halomonas sp. WWR20]